MAIYDINGNEITSGGGSTVKAQTELQRRFSGKKIIWLGDSIHAYPSPDGVTIPYLFQYDSGAICYNWAQGGMTMAKMGVANYDPYSGVGMVDALISKNFTEQEAYAADNHGTKNGNFHSEVAEMKAMDMSTVDAIIIEFGTNDAMKMVPLDNEENPLDTTTTGGALRYMIKNLQTKYPTLKIVVLNVQRMAGYADAEHKQYYDSKNQNEVIESVCAELAVIMIDIYNLLGVNDYTKGTLLADGLHRSHKGKVKQAQSIENQMCLYF
jgi:lysophospholipase L1-like esterase